MGDLDTVAFRFFLHRIECVPFPANEYLEPCVEIHFFQLIQVTDRHAGRNAEVPA
ncbi:hypothetical protein D3C87_1896170 [compost metagenome]